MSMVHLHLLLNHVPVVGAAFIVALLLLAVVRDNGQVSKVALGSAVVIGVIALAVFFTGEPAEETVEELAGISKSGIERHEDAALLATIAASGFGVIALAILAWFRRRPIPRLVTGGSLVGGLAVAAIMAWTANLGGQIRHSEIRSGVASTSGSEAARESADDSHERKDR